MKIIKDNSEKETFQDGVRSQIKDWVCTIDMILVIRGVYRIIGILDLLFCKEKLYGTIDV